MKNKEQETPKKQKHNQPLEISKQDKLYEKDTCLHVPVHRHFCKGIVQWPHVQKCVSTGTRTEQTEHQQLQTHQRSAAMLVLPSLLPPWPPQPLPPLLPSPPLVNAVYHTQRVTIMQGGTGARPQPTI